MGSKKRSSPRPEAVELHRQRRERFAGSERGPFLSIPPPLPPSFPLNIPPPVCPSPSVGYGCRSPPKQWLLKWERKTTILLPAPSRAFPATSGNRTLSQPVQLMGHRLWGLPLSHPIRKEAGAPAALSKHSPRATPESPRKSTFISFCVA